MSKNENEPEVKDVERVEVVPAGDDEDVIEPETETQPESSQEETKEGEEAEEAAPEGDEEAEEAAEPAKPVLPAASDTDQDDEDGIKRVPGETPKEYALRLEVNRLKGEARRGRSGEILTPPPAAAKKELSPEKQAILKKFKPEEMQAFREVLDVAAEEMGFVKKDELGANAYQERATEVLDSFLEKHPEYLPQNDPGNVLWDRFKGEFSLYKQPANPKDLKKVLEKVHKEVFGIKPAAALNSNDAAKEKVKVASHGGASRPKPSQEGIRRSGAPSGLRTDMLKGFTDEEIAELEA